MLCGTEHGEPLPRLRGARVGRRQLDHLPVSLDSRGCVAGQISELRVVELRVDVGRLELGDPLVERRVLLDRRAKSREASIDSAVLTVASTNPGDRMNFDIKTEQVDGAYVIALAGEVDLYTAPEFKQQLLDVIAKGGKEVIVDFSDTTFIDSTTLGVLVGGVKRLRTNDGQLSLVCSDRNITKIFEITGLDRVFTIYPTRDEALAKVGASSQPPA